MQTPAISMLRWRTSRNQALALLLVCFSTFQPEQMTTMAGRLSLSSMARSAATEVSGVTRRPQLARTGWPSAVAIRQL